MLPHGYCSSPQSKAVEQQSFRLSTWSMSWRMMQRCLQHQQNPCHPPEATPRLSVGLSHQPRPSPLSVSAGCGHTGCVRRNGTLAAGTHQYDGDDGNVQQIRLQHKWVAFLSTTGIIDHQSQRWIRYRQLGRIEGHENHSAGKCPIFGGGPFWRPARQDDWPPQLLLGSALAPRVLFLLKDSEIIMALGASHEANNGLQPRYAESFGKT